VNRDFRDLLAEFNDQRIDGVDFDEGWSARVVTRFADVPAAVLSREHLIRNKRASGRTQDLADLEWLEGSREE
jgi:hypothetical protein